MKIIDTKALKALLTQALEKLIQIIEKKKEVASTTIPGDSTAIPETNSEPETPETPKIEEIPASIDFKIVSFGSPDVSKAKEDPETQIEGLKISRSGLSYRWRKGGCERFGAKDKHDHTKALAIAGYGDGKTFRAAKFDWISTDRLTRDFANIDEGYNGFSADAFWKAPKRCFFIMSADGKRRTNVLCQ